MTEEKPVDEKLYWAMKNYCFSLYEFLNGESYEKEIVQKMMWYDLLAIVLYMNKDGTRELIDTAQDYDLIDRVIERLAGK